MCLQAHANEKSLFLKFFTCSKRRFRNYTVCDVTKGFDALPSWLFFFTLCDLPQLPHIIWKLHQKWSRKLELDIFPGGCKQ